MIYTQYLIIILASDRTSRLVVSRRHIPKELKCSKAVHISGKITT